MVKFNRNREEIEDLEEYEDEEYEERAERSPLIKYGIIGGIVIAVIIGAVLIRMGGSSTDEKPQPPQTEQVEQTSEETPKVEVPKESESKKEPQIVIKGKDEATAKESLERPDAPLTAEQTKDIKEHIASALEKMASNPNGAKNDPASGLYLTSSNTMDALRQLLLLGYSVDAESVHGYLSNNDNVYQFTVNFTKDGASPVTLTGNYSPSMEQLGFVQVHGQVESGASRTNESQVDTQKAKENSDAPVNPDAVVD